MKRALPAVVILLLAATPARAHRLDQYLQGTLISVEKNRVDAQMTLTPGVAVFPILIGEMDGNADGVISQAEQTAYAGQILRDISISIDGHRLMPRLLSAEFPAIEEMKEGRGEIRIEFDASLPGGGSSRKLVFENRHQSRIAAYQVNCLVPRDPDIRILAQNRNYSQSFYELDFAQPGAPSMAANLTWLTGAETPLLTLALFLFARLAWVWGQRARVVKGLGGRDAECQQL